jgi:hypothetical protein
MAAAWLSALDQGLAPAAVASALISTGLCAALLLLAGSGDHSPREIRLPRRPKDDSVEFRRELHHLCAALKLSINFCERHPELEPDVLLGEVEDMGDSIGAFVNQIARPVRLTPRVGCAADVPRPRLLAP